MAGIMSKMLTKSISREFRVLMEQRKTPRQFKSIHELL